MTETERVLAMDMKNLTQAQLDELHRLRNIAVRILWTKQLEERRCLKRP